ncbi:MAG: PIN domain-containing protein [Caulobacteraceae bacterium]
MITADTNVLVYLWDNYVPTKTSVAALAVSSLMERASLLGLQVIGETQNALRRKLRQPPWQAAQNARALLSAFDTFVASEANVAESLTMMAAGRLSYWDALLITAARDAGCRTLLSEDMQDGARFGDLEILNPFGATGPSERLNALLSA